MRTLAYKPIRAASLVLVCGVLLAAAGWGGRVMAADAAAVIGWVEVQPGPSGPGHVTLRGHVHALKDTAGKFSLQITRTSRGGKSDGKQGGDFNLKAGESRPLSTTTININPDDKLTVQLTITVDGAEVFTTTLRTM